MELTVEDVMVEMFDQRRAVFIGLRAASVVAVKAAKDYILNDVAAAMVRWSELAQEAETLPIR